MNTYALLAGRGFTNWVNGGAMDPAEVRATDPPNLIHHEDIFSSTALYDA